ncbi:energy transducer TonB [Hymenobacter terricola]|uniref:energy transducer TonB n=1 Tax=Hymenobacter terricola TaxID=2819236 RepID=UPI001B312C72|nr:TonB family protein [Hymenobacter terricola]
MKQAFILCFLLIVSALGARAQKLPAPKEAVDSTHVYTYVEKMPQLLSGGGFTGIVNEFSKQLRIPAFTDDGDTRYSGIHVTFIVGADGQVRNAEISKSSNNPVIDNALLATVRSLPRLSPGYHNGQAVPVRLTIPISCIKPQ